MKKQISIEELKKIQVEILDDIDSFCKQNHLTYFLIYGSLLGAVRHKGYIPWDDDIDITMPRKDYEIFCRTFQTEKCYLNNYHNSKDYYHPFSKVIRRGTYVEEETNYTRSLGINIDIFPMDKLPADKIDRYFKTIFKYGLILNRKVRFKTMPLFKKILIVPYLLLHIFQTKKHCLLKMEKNASMYEYGEIISICPWVKKERISSDCFSEIIFLDFENKQYPCPKKYDECLKILYGDYMKFPPENERNSGHKRKDYIIV